MKSLFHQEKKAYHEIIKALKKTTLIYWDHEISCHDNEKIPGNNFSSGPHLKYSISSQIMLNIAAHKTFSEMQAYTDLQYVTL